MTPVERLEAAIEKLERLKATTTPGPWVDDDTIVRGNAPWETPHGHAEQQAIFMAEGDYVSGYAYLEADADLVVTLHRTIDAQLTILRDEFEMCSIPFAGMYKIPSELPLALADAILGETQ